MPTFSISEYNESLLSNCRTKKMYAIVKKTSEILTSQYIGTCKSAYTKGYALNWALTFGSAIERFNDEQGNEMEMVLMKKIVFEVKAHRYNINKIKTNKICN